MIKILAAVIFLFFVGDVSGQVHVQQADVRPLVHKINERVGKLRLGNEKDFSRLVGVVRNDVVEFSSSTGSNFDLDIATLIQIYEKLEKEKDSSANDKCNESFLSTGRLSEECKCAVFKKMGLRTTLALLHLAQMDGSEKLPTVSKDGKPTEQEFH